MSHGIPGSVTGSNAGTIANSCIVTSITAEVTDDSKGCWVTLFSGAPVVKNKIASLGVPTGYKTNSVNFGEQGILAQDELQCVTTANCSWAGIAVRQYAG